MKYLIFLDVNGVLNSTSRYELYGAYNYQAAGINPLSLVLLRELCRRVDAGIVIVSGWRKVKGPHIQWWKGCFAAHGWPDAQIAGLTSNLKGIVEDEKLRGLEIKNFLYQRKETLNFVIFDDSNKRYFQDQPLIKVNNKFGLSLGNVLEAYARLTGRKINLFK